MLNGAEVHYLSENSIHIEPLHLTQMRQKMQELKDQYESELAFTEHLHKEGLLEFYMREKFKSNK